MNTCSNSVLIFLGEHQINVKQLTLKPDAAGFILSAVLAVRTSHLDDGWRSQYVYHFCDRSQTLGGHISVTIGLQTKNSADLERGAAPRSFAAEFFVCNPIVTEIWPPKV